MPKKKTYKTKSKPLAVNEPIAVYGDTRIHIFKSFEEQKEFKVLEMAKLSPTQLMDKLEAMRKIFLRNYLLPDGNWKPIEKTITIKDPFK